MKLKALVAIMALATGVAHADIVNVKGTTDAGSLLLGLYNPSAGVSSLYDLGLDTSSFSFANVAGLTAAQIAAAPATQTLNISWNLVSGSVSSNIASYSSLLNLSSVTGSWSDAWTSYKPSATGSSYFEVIGGDTTTSPSTSSIITTSRTALAAGTTALGTGSNLTQMGTGTSTWIAANAFLGNHSSVANGADYVADQSTAYQGDVSLGFKDKWSITTSAVFNADQTLDSSANFYGLKGNSSGTLNTLTDFNGAFAFDASTGTLTYSATVLAAAVPEASTYAMLLAGLGLMGFMARRRAK
jgi:hypothetical protein